MENKVINIVVASDHAGYHLKEYLKENLSDNYNISDLGTHNTNSVDYPDYAQKVADFMKIHHNYYGILICGSGIGISIAANRCSHIRAALCHNDIMARLARMHNDANVVVFGARIITKEEALNALRAFLSTKFEGGRHQSRIEKLI